MSDYAARNEFQIIKAFEDVETAKTSGRTQFTEMVAWFKRNRSCRTLLVEKTDRLYRNFKDAVTLEDLDIEKGLPVGALVFAENAIAGSIWLPGETQIELAGASVVGHSLRTLSSAPAPKPHGRDPLYARQARLFGDAGQEVLGRAKVGLIGLGGAGSLLAEYLGRLGAGSFVLVDPDRVAVSNLPRLTGAMLRDALYWFADDRKPAWMRRLAVRFARPKVHIARRNILRANPRTRIEAIFANDPFDRFRSSGGITTGRLRCGRLSCWLRW